MKYILLYDEITGEIQGRIQTTDEAQLASYPMSVEVSREEAELEPELFTKVNPSTKVREELTAAEVADKMKVDESVAAERLEHFVENKPE